MPLTDQLYTYDAPWPVFATAWTTRPDRAMRLAAGSFLGDYSNRVRLIELDDNGMFHECGEFEHPYPTTKLQFIPDAAGVHADLLATSGDYLRVWEAPARDNVGADCVLKLKLDNNQKSEFCAPLTSFDWNAALPSLVVAASIDTTCTVWDLNAQIATTQLIAHDKEVYDVAFARSTDVFASVGADGSMRLFDLRSLEHSTILFECAQPLLRLAWNKQDPNYVATFSLDSTRTILIDVRVPSIPCAELSAHTSSVNSIAWAPQSSCHICTAGDDSRALIWDLRNLPAPITQPLLSFAAAGPINQVSWSSVHNDWLAIAFSNRLQLLRV